LRKEGRGEPSSIGWAKSYRSGQILLRVRSYPYLQRSPRENQFSCANCARNQCYVTNAAPLCSVDSGEEVSQQLTSTGEQELNPFSYWHPRSLPSFTAVYPTINHPITYADRSVAGVPRRFGGWGATITSFLTTQISYGVCGCLSP
jgi:hypothetical protein